MNIIENNIRINVMVHIKNLTDAALSMFNEKPGKVISVGKKESYVRFHFGNKTYFEFIPNKNMKLFANKDV